MLVSNLVRLVNNLAKLVSIVEMLANKMGM